MKKLFLTSVVFSVLFIGCQENSITDPIANIDQKEVNKSDDPSVHQGTITLEAMLADPNPVMNSYYIVSGEIQYQHSLVLLDPIPPNPQYSVDLNFSVTADFTDFCTVCEPQSSDFSGGTISIETNDNVFVSVDGIYLLEKSFPIQGREDGMFLVCRFLVTTDGVGLNEMWLELPDTQI
jgi:hypothetical protein